MAQALGLGALHGPTELLPISSSAHTTAVPWLLGSEYPELDPELRKTLEVALHTAAATALLLAWRQALRDDLATLDARQLRVLVVASAPAALAGYLLQDSIERRLGRPPAIAGGLLLGAIAMALADRRPQRRGVRDATAVDALWLGLAQATALIPGVSRSGSTLAAARLRCFHRADAAVLSRRLALPVTLGASALTAWQLAQRPLDPSTRVPLAAGLTASFVSTLLATRLLRAPGAGPLWPYVVYRAGLAGAIIERMGRGGSIRPPRAEPPTSKDMPGWRSRALQWRRGAK